MCKMFLIYVLTITTEINSGHVIYSEEFIDKTECDKKAQYYSTRKYILDAKCDAKTTIEETENVSK